MIQFVVMVRYCEVYGLQKKHHQKLFYHWLKSGPVIILNRKEGRYYSREAKVVENPEDLKAILSRIRWKILELLSEEPMYPAEIARNLHMQEQKVHYHVKYLRNAGAIEPCRRERIRGGLATYYKPSSPAFAVVLPFGESEFSNIKPGLEENALTSFLSSFTRDGTLNARMIVGSPIPHGPFKATARDGHYVAHLGLFLGHFVKVPDHFCVKLDTDLKAEKEEDQDLILIGGPGTNLITSEVNPELPIRFSEDNFWRGIESSQSGDHYTQDSVGIVAKIPNPKNDDASILVLAGLRAIGTKSTVLGLCDQWEELLKGYHGQDTWACAVRGYDFDGDGKVDGVEVLERVTS